MGASAVCTVRQIKLQVLDLFFTSCETLDKAFHTSLFPYGSGSQRVEPGSASFGSLLEMKFRLHLINHGYEP